MMMGPGHLGRSHNMSTVPNQALIYVDPVCGENVEIVQEYLTYHYNGRTFYFNSDECMDQFKTAPDKYIQVQPAIPQKTENNNIVTWSLWGAAAGALMLLMLL